MPHMVRLPLHNGFFPLTYLSCAGSIATVHIQTYVHRPEKITQVHQSPFYSSLSLPLHMHRHLLCSAISCSNRPCLEQPTHPDTLILPVEVPVHQFLVSCSSFDICVNHSLRNILGGTGMRLVHESMKNTTWGRSHHPTSTSCQSIFSDISDTSRQNKKKQIDCTPSENLNPFLVWFLSTQKAKVVVRIRGSKPTSRPSRGADFAGCARPSAADPSPRSANQSPGPAQVRWEKRT